MKIGLSVVVAVAVAGAVSPERGWCQSAPIVQPGAPGEPSRIVTAEAASDLSAVGFTPADVSFMQQMIGHHAQAVEMTALLPSRTTDTRMRALATRIEISQHDEMEMMRGWLAERGQEMPGAHAHHAHTATLMPGMLTPDEMAALSAATGGEFDRLFLLGMIKHHQGALVMVEQLLATPGAAQESAMYAFVSDVDIDQRLEIGRMSTLLKELGR